MGQFTLNDLQRAEVDRRLELTISGVKVRRRVIVEEHSDHDPIEGADRRHGATDFTISLTQHPRLGFLASTGNAKSVRGRRRHW